MAWTRLAHFHGECGNLNEVEQFGAGTVTASTVESYTGNYAIRCGGTVQFGKTFDSIGYDQLRGGFYFRHNGWPSAGNTVAFIIFGLYAANQLLCGYGTGDDGKLWGGVAESWGPTTKSVYTARLGQTQRWRQVNWWFDTNDHLYLYVDGLLMDALSVIDIDDTPTQIRFGGKDGITGGWVNFVYVDDCWVDGSNGETVEVGPTIRFWPSAISADGSFTDWTANTGTRYQAVDEIPADDDTTYVSATAAAQKNSFQTADLTFDSDLWAVTAALMRMRAKRDTAGPEIRAFAYDGANTINGSDQALAASYADYVERFTAKPAGGAWSFADFNSSEFAVEARGTL